MSSDRPDYTGSIVIEDIENVTAVITVTGAVTVTGDITITNSTIAVTQSGGWTIESITGPVTITGAVTITSGNITGTVAISGTANINIAQSSVAIDTTLTTGTRPTLGEADSVTTVNAAVSDTMGAATANTTFVSHTVNYSAPKNIQVSAAIVTESGYGPGYSIKRDGTTIKSGTCASGALTAASDLDENVAAGLHTYSLEFDASGNVSAALTTVNEDMDKNESVVSSGATDTLPYTNGLTQSASVQIVLAEAGDVWISLFYVNLTGGAFTLTLWRDGEATSKTWDGAATHGSELDYLDTGLAAGTHTYQIKSSGAIYGNMVLVVVTDGVAPQIVYLTPHLENLNVGLDTRVPKATTPILYNVTMTTQNTEYSQALPTNCKRFTIQTTDGTTFRIAYVTGKVATPTAPYFTILANGKHTVEGIEASATTLYFACGTNAKVVEIEAWS